MEFKGRSVLANALFRIAAMVLLELLAILQPLVIKLFPVFKHIPAAIAANSGKASYIKAIVPSGIR